MKTKMFLIIISVILLSAYQVDAALELLVTSRNTNNVLRYDGTTGAFIDEFVPSGSGGLSSPGGITFRQDGYVYISSHNTGQASVKRYDAQTGEFVDNFTSGRPDSPYTNLVFGPDGNLYVTSEDSTSNVHRFDGNTGAYLGEFLSGGSNLAVNISFGPDGNLYANNILDDTVDRYNGTTGLFIDEFVPKSDNVYNKDGLIFGPDENLYLCRYFGTDGVHRYDGQTGAFIDIFIEEQNNELGLIFNLTFGEDENLYISNFSYDKIDRYDGQSGDFIDVFSSGGGLDHPIDLVFIPEPGTFSLLAAGIWGMYKKKHISENNSGNMV